MTFSPSSATRMIATPVGASTSRTSSWTPAARSPASASSAIRIGADTTDHADVRAEPGGGDSLVRSFSAWDPLERGAAQSLPGTRQALDPSHEVEVDRPDDGEGRARGARVRRRPEKAAAALPARPFTRQARAGRLPRARGSRGDRTVRPRATSGRAPTRCAPCLRDPGVRARGRQARGTPARRASHSL